MGSCLLCWESRWNTGSPRVNNKRRKSCSSSWKRFVEYMKVDYHLVNIPGRVFSNGFTDFASLFTQQGRKGTNQDAMIVWEDFWSRTNTIFCGVFDGHGPNGHLVAKRVRDSLPQKLNAEWEVHLASEGRMASSLNSSSSMNSEDSSIISVDVEEPLKKPNLIETLTESFLKAFKIMDEELRERTSVDCFCSGTTAVTLIKQGQDLVIGNVGDSRAVMGTRAQDNTLVAVQLTVDLNPNLPAEAERIKKCRGRVLALRDEPDVARVWLPYNDSPGLAMARAFGDFCLKDFGLIAVPEISYRHLTDKDEFIVLSSDGIWDVLSNQEVVDIIASAPRTTAAKTLVQTAVQAWKAKYPTSKVDDCAVICLYLNMHNKEIEQLTKQCLSRNEQGNADCSTDHQDSGKDDIYANDEYIWDEDYSALEGVSRVNTLFNLPRFTPNKGGG